MAHHWGLRDANGTSVAADGGVGSCVVGVMPAEHHYGPQDADGLSVATDVVFGGPTSHGGLTSRGSRMQSTGGHSAALVGGGRVSTFHEAAPLVS